MSLTVPALRPHDQAVVDYLRATQLIAEAQTRIGDGKTPADATTPYAIVYPAGGPAFDGPLGDPHADTHPASQITCVGRDRNEAAGLADSIRAALLSCRDLDVPGRALAGLPELELTRPVQRDDTIQPPEFYAVDLYRFHTVPA